MALSCIYTSWPAAGLDLTGALHGLKHCFSSLESKPYGSILGQTPPSPPHWDRACQLLCLTAEAGSASRKDFGFSSWLDHKQCILRAFISISFNLKLGSSPPPIPPSLLFAEPLQELHQKPSTPPAQRTSFVFLLSH